LKIATTIVFCSVIIAKQPQVRDRTGLWAPVGLSLTGDQAGWGRGSFVEIESSNESKSSLPSLNSKRAAASASPSRTAHEIRQSFPRNFGPGDHHPLCIKSLPQLSTRTYRCRPLSLEAHRPERLKRRSSSCLLVHQGTAGKSSSARLLWSKKRDTSSTVSPASRRGLAALWQF
jgi:hypothetical protein